MVVMVWAEDGRACTGACADEEGFFKDNGMLAEEAAEVNVGVDEELAPKKLVMTELDWCNGPKEEDAVEEEEEEPTPALSLGLNMCANWLDIFNVKLGTFGSGLGSGLGRMLTNFKLGRWPTDGGRPRRFLMTGRLLLVLVRLLPAAVVVICSTFMSEEDEELAEERAGEWGDEEVGFTPAVIVERTWPLPLTIVTVCEVEGLKRLTRITGSAGVALSKVLLLLLLADPLEGVEAPAGATAQTTGVAGSVTDALSTDVA